MSFLKLYIAQKHFAFSKLKKVPVREKIGPI